MDDLRLAVRDVQQNQSNGGCDDVDKMLMATVEKRKTVPLKCLEINKEISACQLVRLERALVLTEECKDREKFIKMIQDLKTSKTYHFTLNDIKEAEEKMEKYCKRTKEINCYLEKRKKGLK